MSKYDEYSWSEYNDSSPYSDFSKVRIPRPQYTNPSYPTAGFDRKPPTYDPGNGSYGVPYKLPAKGNFKDEYYDDGSEETLASLETRYPKKTLKTLIVVVVFLILICTALVGISVWLGLRDNSNDEETVKRSLRMKMKGDFKSAYQNPETTEYKDYEKTYCENVNKIFATAQKECNVKGLTRGSIVIDSDLVFYEEKLKAMTKNTDKSFNEIIREIFENNKEKVTYFNDLIEFYAIETVKEASETTVLEISTKLNRSFSSSYDNPQSNEFKTLEKEFCNGIEDSLQKNLSFSQPKCSVNNFKKGSVIVNYIVSFLKIQLEQSIPNIDVVKNIVEVAIEKGIEDYLSSEITNVFTGQPRKVIPQTTMAPKQTPEPTTTEKVTTVESIATNKATTAGSAPTEKATTSGSVTTQETTAGSVATKKATTAGSVGTEETTAGSVATKKATTGGSVGTEETTAGSVATKKATTGGSLGTQETHTGSVATDGVTTAGSLGTQKTHTGSVATDGVTNTGSAATQKTHTGSVATDGVTTAGSAATQKTHTGSVATDGVTNTGSAATQKTHTGSVATDGVTTAGSAATQKTHTGSVATDGVTTAGSAATQKTHTGSVATDGVTNTGSAATQETTTNGPTEITSDGNVQTSTIAATETTSSIVSTT
ncbi:DgyrCDS6980 [Dimorphilus gyrociliatus]|uniref:DgyrCDS6980 n=1 Tax=Dimorphilus gyrociliatus TaxID=2664684 RepID=A0A7I8VR91_9ANNE|nr:DgyrCDS6980 [Dimorphilus gyrociliatus]